MNDDQLLEELGTVQRHDEQRLDGSPRGQLLHRPLDADFRRQVEQRVQSQLSASPDSGPVAQGGGDAVETESEPASGDGTEADGKVLRGRFGRRGWWIPLTMAAGIALLLLPDDRFAPLPDYQVEIGGYVQQQRSAALPAPSGDGTVLPFETTGILTLRLRPETAVEGPLVTSAVARSSGGELLGPLPFEQQTSELGAVSLRGRVADLGLTPGQWTLIVAAGRPGELPEPAALVQATDDDHLHLIRQTIRVLDALGEDD